MIVCPVQGAGMRRPDAFTKLHLRMNGEGNVFKDLTGKTVTANGNATQNSGQSFFLGRAAYLDGNGDWIAAPYNFYDFGSGNFTIEGWAYPTAVSGYDIINMYSNTGTKRFVISINSSGYIRALCYNASATYFGDITGSANLVNTWFHYAYVRNGSNFTLYVNGISVGTATSSETMAGEHANSPLRQGMQLATSQYYYTGYVSETRISNIARYTAAFTQTTRRQ